MGPVIGAGTPFMASGLGDRGMGENTYHTYNNKRGSTGMRAGRHMPTNSKMVRAAEVARQIGCEAIQIFASNPTAWRAPVTDPIADAAFAQAARDLGLDPV